MTRQDKGMIWPVKAR